MQNKRLAGFPAALFAVGLGLTMYYGYAWYQLPVYSEAEIAQSVEINLMMDLQRKNQVDLPAERIAAQRRAVENEVRGEIAKERQDTQRAFLAGVVALGLALGQMALLRRLSTRGKS